MLYGKGLILLPRHSPLFLSLIFFFSGITVALGQDEKSVIVGKLTDDSQKEWRLDNMTTTLGKRCSNGEVLFISKNYTLIARNCVKGYWVSLKRPWSVSKMNDQWTISIGAQKYLLVLGKEGKRDRLVLRTVAAGKKGATVDRIFLSEKS
jgi:hypothetical protein